MILPLNLPLNGVSFGQTSIILLRELINKNKDFLLFPIGNSVDLSCQSDVDDFLLKKIDFAIKEAYASHKRSSPIFKLWHLNGSLESFSEEQNLFSFYELDNPTRTEINIVKNNKKVLFSSNYTVDLFKSCGCNNVYYVPLCFDKYNFSKKDKKYFNDDRIVFNVVGKLEKRKHHEKIIKSWLSKYGNNKKYYLQCAIYNPFLRPEQNQQIFASLLEGKNYFNIAFLPYMQQNTAYNDFLNSADIVIGMSGGEGWGLPEFHSVSIGKHAVILNAHSYKDWANENNSILVSPNGKTEVYDGVFFNKGLPFNQGSIYDFDTDEFLAACEKAIEKVKTKKLNEPGLSLQEEFSSEKFLENILSHVK